MISAGERPYTYDLDRTAIGTGTKRRYNTAYINQLNCNYFKLLDNGARGRQTADSLGFALNKVHFVDFNFCD